MRTRKALLAAIASSAIILPLTLAAPASADPAPRCEAHVNCEQHTPNGDVVRLNIGIGNGGNCDQDKLLLVRVRIDAGHAHRDIADAQRANRDAQSALAAAKTRDTDAATALASAKTLAAAKLIAYNNALAAKPPVPADIAAAHSALTAANTAVGDAQVAKNQTASALTTAQTNATTAANHLAAARDSGRILDAKIALLTSRINGTECHPVPPVVVPPVETTTDAPPPAVIVPPANNNTQVIVEGPQPVVVPGPSQVGQAPQGYVSAGGGADAAIVSATS